MKFKKLTAILLIICMMATFMPTAFASTSGFRDFPTGWSKEAMTAAVNNGLLVGVNATEIRPTANLTRAELATIVVRAFGAKTMADISNFADVPENAWYHDYISKAVKMEALKGKSDTMMDPLSPITREEVFTALARILVLESDNSTVLSKFNDKAEVSDWAVKSVSALVEKGYVNGDDLGNVNPKSNITREEFAQFMHNMIKVYITKPGTYTENMDGIVVLRTGDVTLRGAKVVSDLVAGDGVMFDKVKIEDAEITGRLLTRGGEFTIKRTTVGENVVVKNVNGVVHFNNYRDEKVFEGINEITKATFLSRTTGGGSYSSSNSQHTIKFDANGGVFDLVTGDDEYIIEIDKYGKIHFPPNEPTYEGFEFAGWYDAAGNRIVEGDTVTKDMVLIAKWKADYIVIHKFETLNGKFDDESLWESEKMEGFVGENTAAQAKVRKGFTPKSFSNVVITDPNHKIVIEYVRNKHDVTFKLDNGTADVIVPDVAYGTKLSDIAPTGFTKDGWAFAGWDPEITADTTLGDADATYTAKWSQTHAQYIVKHIREGLDGTYAEVSDLYEFEYKFGEIGKNTAAEAKTYGGFTALSFEQIEITAGGAVVTIKYERNKYDVTFKLDNGTADVVKNDVKFGTPIANIIPTGITKHNYEFVGWNPAIADDATLGVDDITYTAKWNKTHSDYVVKHIRENLDGTYDVLCEEENMNGRIGDETDITARTYEGFTAVVENVTIPGTDDLVVTVKYKRNTYDVTFVPNNGQGNIVRKNVKYGASIMPLVPEVSKTDYGFMGWVPAITDDTVLGDGPATYEAQWSQTHARYTVKHIQESLDGKYELIDPDLIEQVPMTGEIGKMTQAVAKTYVGFTALPFDQVEVRADGNTVVIIKYQRNKHTVTFKLDNGDADVVISDVKFGTSISTIIPAAFTKENYEFAGWNPDITGKTLGDADETYTAVWTKKQAKYTVRFIYESLDPSIQPEIKEDSFKGIIGNEITVYAPSMEGFTPDASSKSVIITEDETAVIEFTYTRNKHDVTFKLGNGDADVVVSDVKYGTLILNIVPANPTKQGYVFDGWEPEITAGTTLGDAPVTYVAKWVPGISEYTVKHIRETLDGNYDETIADLYEEEILDGTTGEQTNAAAKTYEGFTALSFSQVDILADGSAVVTIKYERNKYDITFKLDNGDADVVVSDVKYGAQISPLAPTGFTKEGYAFDGWDPAIDADTILGDADAEYTAKWVEADTTYTVKHIRETLDGNYDETIADLYEEEILDGTTGEQTNAVAKTYEGFTALSFSQVDILADGSAVVTIKYERNKYDVTFKLDNGEADVVVSDVKYGTQISPLAPTGFTKEGYAFDGWDPAIDADTILGDADAEYTAKWVEADTTYTVKHIRETLDGNYDETIADLYEEEVVGGVTGEQTNAVAKTYEGFTALSFSQVDILADGSAVVVIKYARNKNTLTFILDNKQENVEYEVKYGEKIADYEPKGFTKEGHIFDKWDPEFDDTTVMPDEAVVYTALWIPEDVTVRFVVGQYGNPYVLDTLTLKYGDSVEKTVIDGEPVYSTDLYSYQKKAEYAPFYNNETHLTYSDYWYLNDDGEWELFDENVIVKRDIDVYAWYSYLKIQLTVPQLSSLAPPLLATYTPDKTRIMDTAKDLLYGANNVWIKNFVTEDKYLELRDKAFEKIAKTGVIDEYGQILINKLPVKITSVIAPEDIHKEVKKYIRGIITNEDKLDQIFGMVSPSDLINMIGVEELIGMLSNQQIADIINGMAVEDVVDLIIDYPDVKVIVVDALKSLIKPDSNGKVANIDLRNKAIAQIEHQLATDGAIRQHILGDKQLLDWVLTSFESDIENMAVNDDDFIATILADDTIRVSMIDKLLANATFVNVLKKNDVLKKYLVDNIKTGAIGNDIKVMLHPNTGNAAFKKAILDEVKGNAGLLATFNSSMSDSILNSMGGFGTSAELKAYVLHVVKQHYGIGSSYTGTNYASVIDNSLITDKIAEAEAEVRNSDIKDYVLDVVKVHYGLSSDYSGDDYSSIIPNTEIENKIAEVEDGVKNSDIKDYVLDVVKVHYGLSSDYSGDDYSSIIPNTEIENKIAEAENEIRNSTVKEYVLHVVNEHYNIDDGYTGEDYSNVISKADILELISNAEAELQNPDIKDYVIHVVNEHYGNVSGYDGEDYSDLISDARILGIVSDKESEIRTQYPGIADDDVHVAVLQTLEDSWDTILNDFISEAVIDAVDAEFDSTLEEFIGEAVVNAIEDDWDTILDEYLADAVVNAIEDDWDTIIDEYLADAVIDTIEDTWDELFGDVSDTDSIAYKVKEYKDGAIDAFIAKNGDLTGTDYEVVQDMIDDAIISLVYDFVNGETFDPDVENKIAEVMMDFALQDVKSVTNADVKNLLIEAQDTFKAKAREMDAAAVTDAFITYRDENSDNVAIIEQAIAANYSDIIAFVEDSLFDDEGNLDTNGEIYKTVDKTLKEKAESIPYDTFADLLNMLLENDSDLISGYFNEFVDNPENRGIVEEQVEAYIAEGNIDADFVGDHRVQIENALKNEGIDISAYVTVDVIKTYINNLGDENDKIAFADTVYEALQDVPEFKEFMSTFDNDKDSFKIHKDNTLFVMGIAEAIKSFDYYEIMGMVRNKLPDNKLIDKAIDLLGDTMIKDMFAEAQNDYYQGIADIVAEIQADQDLGIEPKTYDYPAALTFKLNLVEMLESAYEKATEKAISILDSKTVKYQENPYLNYLITNNYLDEILYDTGMGEFDGATGYEIRSEEEYAELVVKYAILIDDAICWYGDNYTEEQRNAIISAVINKTFGLHDKFNELLVEYRATGDLPEKAENVLNGVEQVNKLFTKFQPKLDTIVDKYLSSKLNQNFDANDVLGKDKVQTGLDIMLGTDDPAFTIDNLYEIFYRFDDKTQAKLKQLIDSGKLEKAVKKFEETDLVEIIGKFTDNSKVTSLAEKAQEIKDSGKVKTAFNSVYDLLVLIAEHGIEPFRTDEDVITVIDAYEVSIKGVKFKIARELNN